MGENYFVNIIVVSASDDESFNIVMFGPISICVDVFEVGEGLNDGTEIEVVAGFEIGEFVLVHSIV